MMDPITIRIPDTDNAKSFVQRTFDRLLGGLGYQRASLRRSQIQPPEMLFAGETYPGAEHIQAYHQWSNEAFQKLALANPWFYAGAHLIGKEVAQGVMRVQQRATAQPTEKWEEVIDHPFERVIEGRPNPYMGQFFTWLYQVLWLMLQGESYWMIVPDRTASDIAQLYPLPANRVEPIPDSDRLISGFRYYPIFGRPGHKLEPEQVIFHRFPNPFDYHRGLSPLNAYLMGLKLDALAAQEDLDDYENGLTLRKLISIRPQANNAELHRVRRDIRDSREAGDRYLVLRGGDLTISDISDRRDKSVTNHIRQLTKSEADYVLGIPEGLRSRNATEANAEVADRVFKEKTVWPLMVMLSEDHTAQAVIPFYGDDYRVMFEDIRPVNRELKLREKESARNTMTYNEVREAEGLKPHPDPEIGLAPYKVAGAIAVQKIRSGKPIDGTEPPEPEPVTQPIPPFFEQDDETDVEMTDDDGQDEQEQSKAIKDDLRRWKSIAIRYFRRGNDPASYDFQSDIIPAERYDHIRKSLLDADTEEAIKAIFSTNGKAHVAPVVDIRCPICGHGKAKKYEDHKGLCVCEGCHCTFDPSIESAPQAAVGEGGATEVSDDGRPG